MKEQEMYGPFGLYSRGKPTITHRTEMYPTGEKLIRGVTNAFWDAWQIGLDKNGSKIFPQLPLLDKDPMEPEL
jgi:hypothetical protein